MQKKVLFLITSSFPYGKSESFLEDEYPYLVEPFDSIHIITNQSPIPESREIAKNTKISYLSYLPQLSQKIRSLLLLFNPIVLNEIKALFRIKIGVFQKGVLPTILSSLYTGKRLVKHIENIILAEKLEHHYVVAYSYWCNDMAVGLALLKNKRPNIKCISRAHGYDVYFERNKIQYLPYRELIFKNLDSVNFVSQNGLSYSRQRIGNFLSMKVSHLGTHKFKTPEYRKNKSLRILSCSSVLPVKRIHLIIETLSKIDELHVKWTHLGDGPLMEQMNIKAKILLGSKKNISYSFDGQLTREAVLAVLRQQTFDLFMNLSESEGIPVSMMEALSFGIPVLATDVGGVNEIVEHEVNGYLINENSKPNIIADKVLAFAELNEKIKKKMRANAVLSWNSKFNAKNNYSQFIEDIFR